MSLEALVDRLWPDDPPPTAEKTIQVYVSRLRAVLGDERGKLATAGGGYRLDIGDHEVDARLFEAELEGARRAILAGLEASPALEKALGRWRGRPFGQLADEPSLVHETQRLEDLEAEAQELRAQAWSRAGSWA